ncbi:MAG TPA: hypothetical protein VFI31_19560 [Pirellulales bacterium]|nr:hypothetical protein [Pirellulales bacterium]
MSMYSDPSSSRTSHVDERDYPPDWWRAVVSFLIFVHLFALAVAVLSNWNPSTLSIRLRQNVPLVKPYLQALAMDQAYLPLYGLTFAMEEDTDMAVDLELQLPDGTQRQITLPSNGLWPRERWRRDARLAETAGDLTGERFKNIESLLPQAIAAHYVAKYGTKGGTIRFTRHKLLSLEALGSSDPALRDPYNPIFYTRVYEARIILVGGSVQLLKKEAAAEVAPAAAEKGKP